jgi:hypothetical protein
MRAGRYGALELDQGNRGSARLVGTFLRSLNFPQAFNQCLTHIVGSGTVARISPTIAGEFRTRNPRFQL